VIVMSVSEVYDYPWGRFCFFSDPMATVGQSTVRCVRSRRRLDETLTSGTGISIADDR
jgi:hypothetical protein